MNSKNEAEDFTLGVRNAAGECPSETTKRRFVRDVGTQLSDPAGDT